jgi:TonB-linked SusC/RagA family outer membrane protein
MKFISANKGLRVLFYSLVVATLPISALARAHASPISGACFQQTVSGTVSDGSGPLPGAIITIKGTGRSVVSGSDGKYTITAAAGEVLQVSFIGLQTAEITVGTDSQIDIVLKEEATRLQEVVVNAGYYSVKDKERTGSIARITAKDIESQPVANVLATLQGRMAGVSVTQTTGVPGGGFEIQVRGQNSLRAGGNSPLYIIDGVPYASDPIGTGINSAVLPTQPSPLNSISPDLIQSIEVLKDADATAIYGSRGANGVILITTKRGKAGKTRFATRISGGLGSVTNFIRLMGTPDYLAMRREAYANAGANLPASAYDVNGTWDPSRDTDWQQEIAGGTAGITNLEASVSGGSAATQFLAGGSYYKQSGVFIKDFNYSKGSMNLNVSHRSEGERFRASFTAVYTSQANDQPRLDLTRETVKLAPNAPRLYNDDGTLNWENNTFSNPLRNLEGSYVMKTNDLVASGALSYEVFDGLKLSANLGYTSTANTETTASPSTRFNPSLGVGPEQATLLLSTTDRYSWIIEPQVNWQKDLGSGRFDILAGATFQHKEGNQSVLSATGFPSNTLIHNLSSAATVLPLVSDRIQYRYQAFFGRLNYTLHGRYILNLTGRRDGSSRFGPGRQFANFGAIGGAWLFSEEHLFDGSSLLSFGKLRASYGVTGSDNIGDYQYLDTYTSSGISYGGVTGLQPARLFNPDFAWERNRKLEIAVEAGFWNDRVFVTAGWYRNRSDNQLTGIPLPATTGFPSVQANLNAVVENKGLELTLRTANVETADFSWVTGINLTVQRNRLLKFPNLESSTYAGLYRIGQPLNIRTVYHLEGVDPQTGLYTFRDYDGDGVITGAGDKQAIADFNPKFFGGLQNQFRYRNVSLDVLFQFVKQQNYSTEAFFTMPGTASNQPQSVNDRWQQPGDEASHQMFAPASNSAATSAYAKYLESDGVITDASYIRLKNIALSYQLPNSWLWGATCRIFLEGQNLLTFTPFRDGDPEFISVGYLPPLKVISTGLSLTF